MTFYVILFAVNVVSFLPVYLLRFREHPNPIEILTSGAFVGRKLKLLYARPGNDPFRINFDFTFAVLLASGAGLIGEWAVWLCSLLLAFGFVEIFYTALMGAVFKRAPALVSDIKLARTGLSIAQVHAYWIVPVSVAVLVVIVLASHQVTHVLTRSMPTHGVLPLLLALLLVPPCLYHWRRYMYEALHTRVVYSPALHLWRNLAFGRRIAPVLSKDDRYFAKWNRFEGLTLRRAPTIVLVSVESYGSVIYRDPEYAGQVRGLLERREAELAGLGYGFASTLSEAPIFAGGSWLSYTSFTYGVLVDDLHLHDALFSRCQSFASYESLFHILKRNDYTNVLLCPLGGIDARSLDWAPIHRCFQSDLDIDFRSVGYSGRLVNYFGLVRRYAPPDQYSLNFAYERVRQIGCLDPCCLFFCTLNSHYPWHSPGAAVDDWRTLADTDPRTPWPGADDERISKRYLRAIRYQLDYLLRFVAAHADDDVLVVLFGDHQPPMLTPETMGKHTPVHVIAKNRALLDVFYEHGFVSGLDLDGRCPREIRHEGFLSLFLKAVQAAYGTNEALRIEYEPNGAPVFDSL